MIKINGLQLTKRARILFIILQKLMKNLGDYFSDITKPEFKGKIITRSSNKFI